MFSFAYYQYTLLLPDLDKSCIRKFSDFEWFKKKIIDFYPYTYVNNNI